MTKSNPGLNLIFITARFRYNFRTGRHRCDVTTYLVWFWRRSPSCEVSRSLAL